MNRPVVVRPQEWDAMLGRARQKKHLQQNNGGVHWAGIMWRQGKPHCFVVWNPTLVIDLTARRNYWVAEQDNAAMEQWLAAFRKRQ